MTADRESRRRAAVGFWFAVQRMLRRKSESPWDEPPDDDIEAGSGIPRMPPDSSGSAMAAEVEPDDSAPE